MKFKTVTTILFALLIVSCDQGAGIKKTHDVTEEYIPIKVMTFSSQKDLQKYAEDNELILSDVEGLAQWAHPVDDLSKVKRCDIYVVEPRNSRDYSTLETWGHELAHCIYGSFHLKGQR
jgi:hypothetical protein